MKNTSIAFTLLLMAPINFLRAEQSPTSLKDACNSAFSEEIEDDPAQEVMLRAEHFIAAHPVACQTSDPSGELENRLCRLEDCMRYDEEMARPSVCQWTEGSYHFSLSVAGLAWQAREDGLDFAIRSEDGLARKARTIRPGVEWNGGVEVALGYHVPHYKMDVNLSWIYFNTQAHRTVGTEGSETLYSIWSLPSAPFVALEAQSKWHLNLNIGNLEMGGQFFPRRWLKLRPHIGLTTAWVDQKYNISLEEEVIYRDDIKMKGRFWGIGPRAGVDSQWGLGGGFSLYGNAAVSILYGFFKTRQKETQVFVSPMVVLNERDSFRTSRTVLDIGLGLRWDKMLKDNRYHIGLQFGWDNLIFYKQNMFKRFTDNIALGSNVSASGDLTIQGWSLKAMLGF